MPRTALLTILAVGATATVLALRAHSSDTGAPAAQAAENTAVEPQRVTFPSAGETLVGALYPAAQIVEKDTRWTSRSSCHAGPRQRAVQPREAADDRRVADHRIAEDRQPGAAGQRGGGVPMQSGST